MSKVEPICVYKITAPDGKVYVGSTVNFKSRLSTYKTTKIIGQTRLWNSFKTHGFNNHNFEIITLCSYEDMHILEYKYGIIFNCLGINGLNSMLPKPIKRTKKYECKVRANFILDTDLINKVIEKASKNGTNQTKVITELLTNWVK